MRKLEKVKISVNSLVNQANSICMRTLVIYQDESFELLDFFDKSKDKPIFKVLQIGVYDNPENDILE